MSKRIAFQGEACSLALEMTIDSRFNFCFASSISFFAFSLFALIRSSSSTIFFSFPMVHLSWHIWTNALCFASFSALFALSICMSSVWLPLVAYVVMADTFVFQRSRNFHERLHDR